MANNRYKFMALTLSLLTSLTLAQGVEAAETKEVQAQREEAVAIARKGDLLTASQQLEQLFVATHGLEVEYDYLTILNWAGKNKETIAVYEANPLTNAPNYVNRNVASAYYKEQYFDKALAVIAPNLKDYEFADYELAFKIYFSKNKLKAALDLYDKLDAHYPNDVMVPVTMGRACLDTYNYNIGANVWKKALEMCKQNPQSQIKETDCADSYSACLIRTGYVKEAEDFLKGYIDAGTITDNMYTNYLGCINLQKRYKEVPPLFYNRFATWEKAPLWAMRELATCYEKRLMCVEAADIYRFVMKAPGTIPDDRFKFAYNANMTHKYRAEGLAMYKSLLADPATNVYTQRILDNAMEYLAKGELDASNGLYKLLVEHDKRFSKIYADDMYRAGFPLTARHQYKEMTKDPELAKEGKEGLVKVDVSEESYGTAGKMVKELTKEYPHDDDIPEAMGSWRNKYTGSLETELTYDNDKSDNKVARGLIVGEQWVGDSLWVSAGYGYSYGKDNVRDYEDGKKYHKRIITEQASIIHKRKKLVSEIGVINHTVSDNKVRPFAKEVWTPTDKQKLTVTYSNDPVLSASAFIYNPNGVFGKEVNIEYEYDLNQLEKYYLEYGYRNNEDGNHRNSFGVAQYKLLYFKRNLGKTLERRLHYNRGLYSKQSDYYNSPKFNENFGGEWRWGKDVRPRGGSYQDVEKPGSYFDEVYHTGRIYHIWGVDWDRDYPEKLGLSPYYRFEYVKDIDSNHAFVVGTTHRFKAGDWHGGGRFKYDEGSVDVQYRLMW